jgi:hypothetical protein
MRRNAKLLFLLIATLLLFADVSSAAEKSLESIHDAWRRSLKASKSSGLHFRNWTRMLRLAGWNVWRLPMP